MSTPDNSALARLEQSLAEMKQMPDVLLESTRHYVMPDPEDPTSVYDTCDSLGPWSGLNASDRILALNELGWEGISPEDRQRITERELEPEKSDYARMRDQYLEQAKYHDRDDDRGIDR